MICTFSIYAENADSTIYPKPFFDGEEGVSITNIYIQPSLRHTTYAESTTDALIVGMNGAIVFNNRLAIGGLVNILQKSKVRLEFDNLDPENQLYTNVVYGGVNFEAAVFRTRYFEVTIPFLVFGGLLQTHIERDDGEIPQSVKDEFELESRFWGVEPGLNLEFNVFNTMSLNAGLTYRYLLGMREVNGQKLDESTFSGYNPYISIKFYFSQRFKD